MSVMVVLAVAAGCANQDEKNQIDALTRQSNELAAQNGELRRQLDQSMRANNDLNNQNNDLRDQVSSRDREIGSLQQRQAIAPPPGPVPKPAPGPDKTASGWEAGASGDRVTLSSDILFTPGSATLSPAGEKALAKIATDLKNEYAGMRVRVYGFTDSDPIVKTKNQWKDNLDLSLNRSAAVSRFLWSKGVAKDRIETVGMGDTHFVASNANAANKAKNRRVEIVVVKSR